jgi:glycerophosphoryl diester phosphodiesterase
MTSLDKNIKELTLEEIKKLNLNNTKYKIPTLEETLSLIDGKVPIIVELKYDNKTGLLEKELVKYLDNYKGLFCVKSFNPFIVRWFKNNRPNYIRGLLLSSKKDNLKQKLVQSKIVFRICKPDFLSCDCKLVDNKKIRRGIPVISWTIKNKTNYNKYKNKFDNLICENIDTFK